MYTYYILSLIIGFTFAPTNSERALKATSVLSNTKYVKSKSVDIEAAIDTYPISVRRYRSCNPLGSPQARHLRSYTTYQLVYNIPMLKLVCCTHNSDVGVIWQSTHRYTILLCWCGSQNYYYVFWQLID